MMFVPVSARRGIAVRERDRLGERLPRHMAMIIADAERETEDGREKKLPVDDAGYPNMAEHRYVTVPAITKNHLKPSPDIEGINLFDTCDGDQARGSLDRDIHDYHLEFQSPARSRLTMAIVMVVVARSETRP